MGVRGWWTVDIVTCSRRFLEGFLDGAVPWVACTILPYAAKQIFS